MNWKKGVAWLMLSGSLFTTGVYSFKTVISYADLVLTPEFQRSREYRRLEDQIEKGEEITQLLQMGTINDKLEVGDIEGAAKEAGDKASQEIKNIPDDLKVEWGLNHLYTLGSFAIFMGSTIYLASRGKSKEKELHIHHIPYIPEMDFKTYAECYLDIAKNQKDKNWKITSTYLREKNIFSFDEEEKKEKPEQVIIYTHRADTYRIEVYEAIDELIKEDKREEVKEFFDKYFPKSEWDDKVPKVKVFSKIYWEFKDDFI